MHATSRDVKVRLLEEKTELHKERLFRRRFGMNMRRVTASGIVFLLLLPTMGSLT